MAAKKPRLRQSVNSFPKALRWQVECDYYNKLSPEEKDWLLKFQEAEYGGNGHLMHRGKKEQRRLWLQQKKQQRDAMNAALHGQPVEEKKFVEQDPESAVVEMLDLHAEKCLGDSLGRESTEAGCDTKRKRRNKKRRASGKKPVDPAS